MKVRQSENQNKGDQVAKPEEKWFNWHLHVLVNAKKSTYFTKSVTCSPSLGVECSQVK